ncbi:MAG: hypothetical protein R2795_08800 [Saprospiraceae bacterium]
MSATQGEGVDVIIDFAGASAFNANLNAVALDGRIIMLGFLGGYSCRRGEPSTYFTQKAAYYRFYPKEQAAQL